MNGNGLLFLVKENVGSATKVPKIHVELPSLWSLGFKFFIALLSVLILIYIFAFFLKRLKTFPFTPSKKRTIEVVEITPIMGKWALAVIRIGMRYFLIGISDNSLNLIAEIDEKDLKTDFTSILDEAVGEK